MIAVPWERVSIASSESVDESLRTAYSYILLDSFRDACTWTGLKIVLTVAGIMRAAEATTMREDMVEATVELNSCSIPLTVPVRVFVMPPAMKHIPRTSRMFDKTLPSMLDCTILIFPSLRATILTYRY
jgi:hypothetical protein